LTKAIVYAYMVLAVCTCQQQVLVTFNQHFQVSAFLKIYVIV